MKDGLLESDPLPGDEGATIRICYTLDQELAMPLAVWADADCSGSKPRNAIIDSLP